MILVTGATGNVGGNIVSQLLSAGATVRAMTRNPRSADLPDDVEAVGGDLADPASLAAALEGVQSVFLLWPTLSADHAAPETIEMIAGHAQRIVYLSANGVPDDPAERVEGILDSHATLERLIEKSGLEWTFLRPAGFATNVLWWADQIRAVGIVRWVYGAAGRSLIHERDIAAVAVRALTQDGHAGQKYVLTGPETLTQIQQVQIIGAAIGRPLRFEEIPPEIAREQLLATLPPSAVDGILKAHAAMVTNPEPVTSTVEQLTGTPPRTFRQWATDHAIDFGGGHQPA